jgi:predicted AAA+ superfamily ATPase
VRYIPRAISGQVTKAAGHFPAIILTGPRRSGKTWMLRRLFPKASYFLLEDPDLISRVRSDPQAFLDGAKPPVILDEIQNTPDLFAHIRARVDRQPRRMGQWILTGSQEAPLMQGVTESMAGRAAVLHLHPLSAAETPKVDLLRGGYPEVLARPAAADTWFASYIQTYLERDVRAVIAVRDLATFRRFLALVASRHGQLVNKTDLAAPLGVSVPTITQWLGVLETTAQILIVPPYYDNVGKRLVKSPKVYVADSGLACHLLGIRTVRELTRSPFLGALFEGLIAGEIVKSQANAGRRREVYFFRDEQGLEVDFVVPQPGGGVQLIECKATATPSPAMAAPMLKLVDAMQRKRAVKGRIGMTLVHQPGKTGAVTRALSPGVTAVDWRTWVRDLS